MPNLMRSIDWAETVLLVEIAQQYLSDRATNLR